MRQRPRPPRRDESQNTIGPWRNAQHRVPAARDGVLTKDEYDAFAKDNPAAVRTLPFDPIDTDHDGKLDAEDLRRLVAPRLAAILAAVEKRDDGFRWKDVARLSAAYLLEWWVAEANHDVLLALDVPLAIFHGTLDGSGRVEAVHETAAAFRDKGCRASPCSSTLMLDHDLDWTKETSKDAGPQAYRDACAWTAHCVQSDDRAAAPMTPR